MPTRNGYVRLGSRAIDVSRLCFRRAQVPSHPGQPRLDQDNDVLPGQQTAGSISKQRHPLQLTRTQQHGEDNTSYPCLRTRTSDGGYVVKTLTLTKKEAVGTSE
jgi:hypothetical protein